MQKNWIGKSEGLSLRWEIADPALAGGANDIEVYTTRPDTLYGASFMAIAADHPLAKELAAKDPAIAEFCDQCRRAGTSLAALETAEKTGLKTAVNVVHPLDPDWTVPVYIANFVLMDYGTGAIFGCPSGDQRDLDFARKYNLPVTPVVMPADADAASFVITDDGLCRRWRDDQFPRSRWHDTGPGVRCVSQTSSKPGHSAMRRRRHARPISACATGDCRASATGARRSR
jgi:leucyl-tRNA synthetase